MKEKKETFQKILLTSVHPYKADKLIRLLKC